MELPGQQKKILNNTFCKLKKQKKEITENWEEKWIYHNQMVQGQSRLLTLR